jgi:hypothetical protein
VLRARLTSASAAARSALNSTFLDTSSAGCSLYSASVADSWGGTGWHRLTKRDPPTAAAAAQAWQQGMSEPRSTSSQHYACVKLQLICTSYMCIHTTCMDMCWAAAGSILQSTPSPFPSPHRSSPHLPCRCLLSFPPLPGSSPHLPARRLLLPHRTQPHQGHAQLIMGMQQLALGAGQGPRCEEQLAQRLQALQVTGR